MSGAVENSTILRCNAISRGTLRNFVRNLPNGAAPQIGRSLVRSQLESLKFFIDTKSFRSHYGPGVDSACNRNEYQEHFLGVKVAGV